MIGAFHGVMMPATPSGNHCSSMRRCALSSSTSGAIGIFVRPSDCVAARAISSFACDSGLPCSIVSSRASSSWCCFSDSQKPRMCSARCVYDRSRHAGNARRARSDRAIELVAAGCRAAGKHLTRRRIDHVEARRRSSPRPHQSAGRNRSGCRRPEPDVRTCVTSRRRGIGCVADRSRYQIEDSSSRDRRPRRCLSCIPSIA